MRTIAVVTGTRADYSYLKPLMDEIQKDKSLHLLTIITGMHLLAKYGDTFKLVEREFPSSVKIEMPLDGDQLIDMASYLSVGIKNFSDFLNVNSPDILLVLGDRTESLAAALAAVYLNIPLAHVNGGDVSGTTIDESIRHVITKLAHIHFAHTKENAKRIIKMGENPNRVFVTGALTIDAIYQIIKVTKKDIFNAYNLNPLKKTILAVQHPITTLKDRGYSQMEELVEALDELNYQTLMIYPNCDAGGNKFIELIEKYKDNRNFHIIKNMPHSDYVNIMSHVDLMIGNSSSGIIESPSFNIPVINLGSRQQGRERSENILDVFPDKNKIIESIDFVFNDSIFKDKVKSCKNIFGDGTASKKIVNILKNIKLDETFIQKQIYY